MAKDPAVLFYSQDFLTGTMLMTNEQKGKYITLLCLQHQNGKLSEKDMLKICGEKDDEIWAKFICEDDFFYNKRMMFEANRRKKYTDSRKRNLSHMDSHMENENENVISNKKEEILKKREQDFKILVFECDPLKYSQDMIQEFFDYWSEPNKSNTKMRFELQPTFEIRRRLGTWGRNNKDFHKDSGKVELNHNEYLEYIHKHGAEEANKNYKPVTKIYEGKKKAYYVPINN